MRSWLRCGSSEANLDGKLVSVGDLANIQSVRDPPPLHAAPAASCRHRGVLLPSPCIHAWHVFSW